MAQPVRIWLEISHHQAFAVGGWAFVRADGGAVSGLAGGERRTDAERMALAGLIAALKGAAAGGPLEVRTTSALVAGIPQRIASAETGEDPPADNLDLWAQAVTHLKAASVRIIRVASAPRSPNAFAAGWAEFARDKAKDKGPFTLPIPKPNLAKAGV